MAARPDRDQPRLKDYELKNITETGVEIGRGSYAAVYELQYCGLKCAGKKIHDYLVDNPQHNHYRQRVIEESETLCKMRHPHIVQFIGVYYPTGSTNPTLVMEYLPMTLATAIKKYQYLPDEISYGIFEDVASGICFMHGHTPSCIHRDLSANNVLVDDNMRAKIADLGVAKMLNVTPGEKIEMSKQPGTAAYMPPEARKEHPDYKTDIDIFSFGVMIVHVLCREWPDPANWSKYLDQISSGHPLYGLIKRCLDKAADRPGASEVLESVRNEKAKLEFYHGNKMKMIRDREILENELRRFNAEQREKDSEIRRLQSHITKLDQQKAAQQLEKEAVETEVEKLKSLNEIKHRQIEAKDSLLSQNQQELDHTKDALDSEKGKVNELKQKLLKKDSDTQSVLHSTVCERDQAWQDLSTGEQFHLLHGRSMLKWDTVQQQQSISMTAPQCTLINTALYFGGGQTDNDKVEERKQVFVFNTKASINDNPIQRVRPDCPVAHFGLGNIGGKLVAIGGRNPSDSTLTSEVHVLDNNLQGVLEWSKDQIPSLSIPRARACIVSQTEDQSSTCIAACGGRIIVSDVNSSIKEVSTDVVEVYHTGSPHWQRVTCLPNKGAALRVTVLHNTAYLLGGFRDDMANPSGRDCQCIVLDSLFNENYRKVRGWKVLKDMPSQSATPGHLCGTLLALGGCMAGPNREMPNEKPILAFNQNTQAWVHVANLPRTVSSATAAALPNGKLIIFGGWETKDIRNKHIFVARVTGRMF